MIRSRRLALVAIVFSLGIAACGDPNTTTPLANNKPKVIQLAGTHRATAERAPSVAAMPARGTADSKIAFMGTTEFTYDGQLPALDGMAASWSFAPGQSPDMKQIAKIAASLGVQGDVRTLPADQGGGWAVGSADYSGPVLTVGSEGMLSWWMNSAQAAVSSGCAVVGESAAPVTTVGVASSGQAVVAPLPPGTAPANPTPDVTTPGIVPMPVPDCPAPQPPVGVPTADQALAKAKDLFAAWGYDVSSYQFDPPYADEWNASVNASLLVGAMKAPIMLSVGFGANGAVTYASGSLAVLQPAADYPTVGAAKGLERLKAQQFQYGGSGGGIGPMKGVATQIVPPQTTVARTAPAPVGTATATGAAPAPGVPTATGAATPAPGVPTVAPVCLADTNLPTPPPVDVTAPSGSTAPTPAIVDCGPVNIEPVKVTLNSVKRDVTMVWADDGTIWLLPAYTFGSADGGVYTVIAVADEFIQQPTPEPATTEPVVPGTVAPAPTTAPASDCTALTAVTVPSAPIDQIAKAVIGYCVADAQKLAETFGYTLRVTRQDGVNLTVTADYSASRINVAVENGTVTEFISIG